MKDRESETEEETVTSKATGLGFHEGVSEMPCHTGLKEEVP